MKGLLKRTLLLTAVIIMAVSMVLTGCAGKDLAAIDVLSKTMTAMSKVTSYSTAITANVDMSSNSIAAQSLSIDITGSAVGDVLNKKSRTNMTMSMQIAGGTPQSGTADVYVIDGWVYTNDSLAGEGGSWTKVKINTTMTGDQIAQLTELLKDSTTSTLDGSETVNGTDCYVLAINPDLAALWQWLSSQEGDLGSSLDLTQTDITKFIKDFGMKYWIAKSNFQIVKTEASMTMNMDDSSDDGSTTTSATNIDTSGDSSGVTMTMKMETTYSDYNKTVDIQLPAEAQNAVDNSQ
jgi:hypothetical protein